LLPPSGIEWRQSRTADKAFSSSLGVGLRVNNSSPPKKKKKLLPEVIKDLRIRRIQFKMCKTASKRNYNAYSMTN
jgi:hypothetical protein